MGCSFMSSSMGRATENCPAPTDPNPVIFNIMQLQEIGNHCIIHVNYPNCINFEGDKILVMQRSKEQVESIVKLDPHFLENNHIVARFRPTKEGWDHAVRFVKAISPITKN